MRGRNNIEQLLILFSNDISKNEPNDVNLQRVKKINLDYINYITQLKKKRYHILKKQKNDDSNSDTE